MRTPSDERPALAQRMASHRLDACRRGRLADRRRRWGGRPAPVRRRVPCALSGRRGAGVAAVRYRFERAGGRHAGCRRVTHRSAGLAISPAAGQLGGLLPDGDRRRIGRHLHVRCGLLPQGRGHPTRAALPGVPRLPGQHGRRRAGRRRLCVHGDVGDDGVVVVLSGDREPPHSRGAQRGLPLHRDGPYRSDRDPAVLWRTAGQHGRLPSPTCGCSP